jgi:hypothetical protein
MELIFKLIGQVGFGAFVGWFGACLFYHFAILPFYKKKAYAQGQEEMRERAAKVANDRYKAKENSKNTADAICALNTSLEV